MEEKLAKWSTSLIGGSMIATGLGMLVIFGLPMFIAGEIDLANDPFMLKVFIIGILYILSIYLVASIPGKPVKRRAISWSVSILFHAWLLVYLGIFNDWGSLIFLIGFVESFILICSVAGLGLLFYGYRSNNAA